MLNEIIKRTKKKKCEMWKKTTKITKQGISLDGNRILAASSIIPFPYVYANMFLHVESSFPNN